MRSELITLNKKMSEMRQECDARIIQPNNEIQATHKDDNNIGTDLSYNNKKFKILGKDNQIGESSVRKQLTLNLLWTIEDE